MPKKPRPRLDGIAHRRAPEIQLRSKHELHGPELAHMDEIAIRMFSRILEGKGHYNWTRLPADEIVQGHFVRSETGEPINLKNFEFNDGVRQLAMAIRSGRRMPIAVYKSPFHTDRDVYVCPDDEHSLMAYKWLGISMIPCQVLNAAPAGYASISVFNKKGKINLRRVYPSPEPENFSVLSQDSEDPMVMMEWLINYTAGIADKLRKFHLEGGIVHYHHYQYSCLSNHIDALQSVAILFKARKVFQAVPIIRSMYEAYINLFAEWLAPEWIGPLRQVLSAASRGADSFERGEAKKRYENYLPGGDKSLFGFAELLTTVLEKAKLSALGGEFYSIAYSHLSSIVHQDYQAMAENSALLTSDVQNPDLDGWIQHYVIWINTITVALVSMLDSDIGIS